MKSSDRLSRESLDPDQDLTCWEPTSTDSIFNTLGPPASWDDGRFHHHDATPLTADPDLVHLLMAAGWSCRSNNGLSSRSRLPSASRRAPD